jgi:hypothetical protein
MRLQTRTFATMLTTAAAITPSVSAIAHADPSTTYNITSPTGDVACWLDEAQIRADDVYGQAECIATQHTWAPPPLPPNCPDPHEPVFFLSARPQIGPGRPGGMVQCHENSNFVPPPGSVPLEYGRSLTVGAITCDSQPSGITCTDTSSGHFFRVSRDSYDFG